MQTYCFGCRRQTGNIDSKNASVTYKAIRQKSRCANCILINQDVLNKNTIKKRLE